MTTVLFIEDQLELRAIHTAFLQSRGFHVVTADDGDSGIAAAKAHHPDVVVLDHSLPRRTGVEIARELRRDPELSGVPILMMTAHAFGAVGRKAIAAGCDSFLNKPCSPQRLLQEIMRFTGRTASA